MYFPCDFRLFFFELQVVKKINLVLNCNSNHLDKLFEDIVAENPVFLGLFRHPDSSGASVV